MDVAPKWTLDLQTILNILEFRQKTKQNYNHADLVSNKYRLEYIHKSSKMISKTNVPMGISNTGFSNKYSNYNY